MFLTLLISFIYDFCPPPDPDGSPVLVCDVEHTSLWSAVAQH